MPPPPPNRHGERHRAEENDNFRVMELLHFQTAGDRSGCVLATLIAGAKPFPINFSEKMVFVSEADEVLLYQELLAAGYFELV